MSSASTAPAGSERLLSTLAERFEPRLLAGQMVVGRTLTIRPEGWIESQLDGWSLLRDPALPQQTIRDSSGREVGWLLGDPLGPEGAGALRNGLEISSETASARFWTTFEDELYAHPGRYAAVLTAPAPRVYIDSYGSLPVYFDPVLELAGSSPFLLSRDGTVSDSPLAGMVDILNTDYWYILGTSPHGTAERLLPNHALEMSRWESRRIWPRDGVEVGEPAELLERVAEATRSAIASAAAAGGANISLTAGGDSRVMLACSRDIVDQLSFFTAQFPDLLGKTDTHLAPRIAERFALPYRLLPWREPSERDVDLWLYRTGCTVGEQRGRRAEPTYDQLDGSKPYISGVGSVLSLGLRYYHLQPSDVGRGPVTGEELVTRFGQRVHPHLIERADDWVANAPRLDRLNLYQLFRIEMYYGCWGGPITLGYPDAASTVVYPNGQRAVLDSVMRLPLEYRASGRAQRELIQSRWPELLEIPINKPPWSVAARRRGKRMLHLAQAAVHKL